LIGYRYSSDTSINHKSKIINNKSEIEEKVVKKEEEEIQKNDGENSLASILRERFSKPAKPNSHISTSWQDKAFRYAQSLKIDLTDPNLKSRWLKVFKLAAEGRKAKNLELAYSYLSDYPRPLSSKAKAQYFFWLYENGLPVDKKAGFINLKILFALFVASFLFFLLPFFSNKRTGSVDSDLPRNLKKIEVLRPTPSVPPLSKKSVEDLICEKFGPDCNVAIAVAKAESGLRCDAVSQTNDHGVFQINAVHLPKFNGKSPYDCEANIEVAYQIYKSWGGFRPWTAYTSGRYLKFLKKGGNNYAGSHL
jgi:hypothetical protein